MISILIPVHNYQISVLVNEIHRQMSLTNVDFEILCFDDKSEKYVAENKLAIDSLSFAKIIISKENIGRTKSRQALCNASSYDWLLFLDADVMPKNDQFIATYLDKLNSGYEAIFGGIAYKSSKPNKEAILRWKYGRTCEEVDGKKRNLKPYQQVVSANFIIKKDIFNMINSKIDAKGYGLDNHFAALLKQNSTKILHINNEVYHLGLENNMTYIKKAEDCIITLLSLYNEGMMVQHNNKLLSTFVFLKRIKMNYFMSFIYKKFNSIITKNLLSNNPKILLLQFYKLSYICFKDLNR